MRKKCKECGEDFETFDPEQEYCYDCNYCQDPCYYVYY